MIWIVLCWSIEKMLKMSSKTTKYRSIFSKRQTFVLYPHKYCVCIMIVMSGEFNKQITTDFELTTEDFGNIKNTTYTLITIPLCWCLSLVVLVSNASQNRNVSFFELWNAPFISLSNLQHKSKRFTMPVLSMGITQLWITF